MNTIGSVRGARAKTKNTILVGRRGGAGDGRNRYKETQGMVWRMIATKEKTNGRECANLNRYKRMGQDRKNDIVTPLMLHKWTHYFKNMLRKDRKMYQIDKQTTPDAQSISRDVLINQKYQRSGKCYT